MGKQNKKIGYKVSNETMSEEKEQFSTAVKLGQLNGEDKLSFLDKRQ